MFKETKWIAIILTLSVAVCAGAAVFLFATVKKERDEKTALQNELAEVMKERKKLSLEIDELKLIKNDLEAKLSTVDAQNKVLAKNYEKEKSQNDVVRANLGKREEEIKVTKTELASIRTEKAKLQAKLEDEKSKYSDLKGRIDKLSEVKDALEEKVREVINKQGIELERIVVKSEGELEGKVLVVNRDYNFIVVDLGFKDDVEIGDILTVFRDGKYVGEAQIEKIYDTMSAAAIAKELKEGAIMMGDSVIARAE